MTEDRLDKSGSLLSAIGQEGATIVGGNPDGLYIYAETEDGSVFGAVFRNEGDVVRYYDPSLVMFDLIGDLWDLDDEDKQWLVMEYEINGTKFDVHFTFPDEVDPEDYATDRRRVALKKRYGDKPVIYPPMPDSFRGGSSKPPS
ncbi:MAG TPA: hypothetical protein VF503_05005 [Sphingobium sp.]|uniref:hypothetical protein n=1 Tax=Sphingobium sp. TaxID=1912891 RepID=UPI002ED02C82